MIRLPQFNGAGLKPRKRAGSTATATRSLASRA